MIDIIIPAYNAHETIINTLSSIAIQSIKNMISVYIIDDCSKKGYDEVVNDFSKFLDIKLLKTPKNSGPGVARQIGLDNSNGKYIMFLDSDDLLYDCFSVENLCRNMELKGLDCITGRIHEEREDGNYLIYENHPHCLHGKMYRRSFIDKYNFRFNNSSFSEDKAFNNLILLAEPKFEQILDDIYVYNYNKKSLTKSDKEKYIYDFIKGETYNVHWIFEEAMKRNFKIEKIADLIFQSLYYTFEYYNKYFNTPYADKILKCCKDLYNDDKYLKQYCDIEKQSRSKDEILNISYDEFKKRIEMLEE